MQDFLLKIKNSNHILLVFCLFGIRAGIFGASIGDALFFLGFIALMGFRDYVNSKKAPDINVELREELKELKDFMVASQMKIATKPQEPPKNVRFF